MNTGHASLVDRSEELGLATILLLAIRPKTLLASISPVLVGTALAHRIVPTDPLLFVAVLSAALLIQIVTNLANDLYDHKRGADTAERLGPLRVTQAGLLSPAQVERLMWSAILLALTVGLFLVSRGGVPILIIGILSLVFAVLYTAGPFPLAYHGLGDPFVFLFFGPIAVCGTAYLFSGVVPPGAVLLGAAVGGLASAILLVNNLRDIETDRVAGKRTLAVRFGAVAMLRQFRLLTLGAGVVAGLVAAIVPGMAWVALGALTLPIGWKLTAMLAAARIGADFNRLLVLTSLMLFGYSLLVAFGALL